MIHLKNRPLLFCLMLSFLAGISHLCVQGAVYTVRDKASLVTRFAQANPGDTIIVANGIYDWGQIDITNSRGNNTSAYIVLKSQTPNGVIFRGSTYLQFAGRRILVTGFKFANGNSGGDDVIQFRNGSSVAAFYSRVTNITIDNYNSDSTGAAAGLPPAIDNKWVSLYGTNNRLDHCTFINKSNAGATVVIWFDNPMYPQRSTPTYHLIDSNYFKGRSFVSGNGGETIRVGTSNVSASYGYNVIEYNLFERLTQSEPEIISNKTNANIYRYNTILNSTGGITMRHGRYCTVYGNFIINTDPLVTDGYGIRIIDKGHKVFNNYIEGVTGNNSNLTSMRAAISLYNGLYPSSDTADPTHASGYWPADSCLVAFNTIVDAKGGGGILIGHTDNGLNLYQPLGIIVANNLIKMAAGQAAYKPPTNTALTYFAEGNLYSAPNGLGIAPTTGFSSATLNFGFRADGVQTAPTIVQDAALNTVNYAAFLKNLDGQGQTRSAIYDVGFDELNGAGNIFYTPLDSNRVGAGTPRLANQSITFPALPVKLLGAVDFNPGAVASSGLTVSYTSSNPAVATILGGNIHIVGAGTSVITASQVGNNIYYPAEDVAQTLTVNSTGQLGTYYWVGGTGSVSSPLSFYASNRWNTNLDGSGSARLIESPSDILVIDGDNVGGSSPATGTINAYTSATHFCGQLKLINGANMNIGRINAGLAKFIIYGDTTADNDFVIDSSSSLTLGGPRGGYDVTFIMGAKANANIPGSVDTVATGAISGSLYLSPLVDSIHTRSYITTLNGSTLTFNAGGACYISDSTASSGFLNSDTSSIFFKPGSNMYYYSGRSPIAVSSTIPISTFESGSNLYFKRSNVSYIDGTPYSSSTWTSGKSFGNIFIQNGANIKADGTFYKIDNLTIENGSSLTTHTSGATPILGNLTVNGTLSYPTTGSSNTLVMGGNSPQTISGTGIVKMPNFLVANNSDVALGMAMTIDSTTNIYGKINFGATGQISGAGSFTSKVRSTTNDLTGNSFAGSNQLSGFAPNTVSNALGLRIAGPGIQESTNVIYTSSGSGIIMLSKPALISAIGSKYSLSSDSATIEYGNTNGMNPSTGVVTSTGVQSFQSGTNYIIDSVTSWPFGVSAGANSQLTLGNVITYADVITNYDLKIRGSLKVNNGDFKIRSVDTVNIISGSTGGRPGIVMIKDLNVKEVGDNLFFNWRIESSLNANLMEVESSEDGFVYQSIGKIIVSPDRNDYHFQTSKPSIKKCYHRIKLIRIDNQIEYSDPIEWEKKLNN